MKLITAIPHYLRSIPQLLLIKPSSALLKSLITNNPTQVQLNNLQFEVTNFMDIWAVKEVFINKDYEQHQRVKPRDLVIDIGAGIGDFSIKSSLLPNSTIYAFEADQNRFRFFQKNIKSNRASNIVPALKKVKSLDVIFKENKIKRCNFLKIDCEGGEYQILLNSKQLKKVKHLAMEVHFFNPKHRLQYRELIKQLKELKFEVNEKPNPVHDNIAFLYATNAHQSRN